MSINKHLSALSELTENELMQIDGGETPSQDTSFANDVAYTVVYAFRLIGDGIASFINGAKTGSKYFYK